RGTARPPPCVPGSTVSLLVRKTHNAFRAAFPTHRPHPRLAGLAGRALPLQRTAALPSLFLRRDVRVLPGLRGRQSLAPAFLPSWTPAILRQSSGNRAAWLLHRAALVSRQ